MRHRCGLWPRLLGVALSAHCEGKLKTEGESDRVMLLMLTIFEQLSMLPYQLLFESRHVRTFFRAAFHVATSAGSAMKTHTHTLTLVCR